MSLALHTNTKTNLTLTLTLRLTLTLTLALIKLLERSVSLSNEQLRMLKEKSEKQSKRISDLEDEKCGELNDTATRMGPSGDPVNPNPNPNPNPNGPVR